MAAEWDNWRPARMDRFAGPLVLLTFYFSLSDERIVQLIIVRHKLG